MALTDSVLGFIYNFLFYAGTALGTVLFIGVVTYPLWIKKVFPIPFILLKNSGGATDNQSVTLFKNIIKRGRIIKTAYGPRIKIRGVANTVPMSVLSRDNALPWEAGGVAFIIYEKEIGQFFPVNPRPKGLDLVMTKKKEEAMDIKKIYNDLQEQYPALAHNFRLTTPKSVVAPVSFANHAVKLQPFPIDAITPFAHDWAIRQERAHKKSWLEKYGFYGIAILSVALIALVAVLSFEQTNKSIDDRLVQMEGAGDNLADKIAKRLAPPETPPGGAAPLILPLLPRWWRRKKHGEL